MMFHVEHEENTDKFLEFFVEGAKNLGFSFTEDILQKFSLYNKELVLWNRSVNLTGLQTAQERAALLFADSLVGSLAIPKNASPSIIDIGTGGGFPGIPLKLVNPSLLVNLMEPRANKTAFLHTVIGKLGLTDISVLQKRLESCKGINHEENKWDMAFSKAVSLESILPHVKTILRKEGKLVVFRSTKISKSEILGEMTIEKEIPYELPFGFGTRVLSVLKNVP